MQSACEPVSAPNSLLTGKLTGNFAEFGPPPRFSGLLNGGIQKLPAEFPAQQNREFPNAYQGEFFKEQGISALIAISYVTVHFSHACFAPVERELPFWYSNPATLDLAIANQPQWAGVAPPPRRGDRAL
jgi:hypothetical protein